MQHEAFVVLSAKSGALSAAAGAAVGADEASLLIDDRLVAALGAGDAAGGGTVGR